MSGHDHNNYNEKGELIELGHDAVKGYVPVFLAVFSTFTAYLLYVLIKTW